MDMEEYIQYSYPIPSIAYKPAAPRRYSVCNYYYQRELGMQNGPVIDEPVIIHHVHAGPTARVVAGPRATRASYRVAVSKHKITFII